MATLIITVLLGLMLAYFATFNTQAINISLGGNLLTIPLYVLVITSVLIGLLISALIGSIDSISSFFALKSRDNQIKQKEKTVETLEHKLHDLEIENAQLKGVQEKVTTDYAHSEEKPHRSFLERFRYHPAA